MTNNCPIDVSKMKPLDSMEGEDAEDTKLLKEMATKARQFVSSHEWCERVDGLYLAYGVGGVIAVFLTQITPRSDDVDEWFWVIVGDVPSAYITADGNPTAADALDA